MRYTLVMTILAASLLMGGCMNYYAIPEPLEKQIDRSVTFIDLKRDPEAHKGRILALGGVVLRAKNLKDGTQIEVLQLPLDRYDQPDSPLESSQGRFMVLDPEHHDPAVLKDRRITLVGEVIGKTVEMVDEFEYSFPYLNAQLVHIWPAKTEYAYPPYYSYPYYYYPDPFLYGYPPYWYYRPPLIRPPSNPQPQRRFESPSSGESSPPQSPSDGSNRRFKDKSSK
jgi:outer membrane lipoprotein